MSRHYAPHLENKLQSELRRNGNQLPGNTTRHNKQYGYIKKPYEKKVYEHLKLPSVMEIGIDGQTHINTGDQAKTSLGKMLSQSYRLPFNHSLLGDFQCINGFWNYLTSKNRNDRVRHLSGSDLRNYSKNSESRRVDNFIFILLGAQWEKINAHPKLKTALKESTLPLDCYYITKKSEHDLRVRPRHADWMIWGFEEMRKALKENRNPDFTAVMDDPDKNMFECIFPDCDLPVESEKPKPKPPEQPALLSTNDEPADGNVEEPTVTEPEIIDCLALDQSGNSVFESDINENLAMDSDTSDQGQEPVPTEPALDSTEPVPENTEQ